MDRYQESLPTFSGLVDRFSPSIDEHLARLVQEEEFIPNLHDGLTYSMGLDLEDVSLRGKRLRPVLCLATTAALGGDPDVSLPFACAIELMHNFALVHDDIEDGDEVRRDRPCTYRKYGLAHGVNIGDYLHCKVWSVLLDPGWDVDAHTRLRLLRLMSETLDHTHVGQSLDISARANRSFSPEDYFRLVREKTGYYLSAPVEGGAIAASADRGTLEAIRRYGHAVGPLFQITDDLLDLTPGKGRGGVVGSDIREGKRSYLVALAGKLASEPDRERMYGILDRPREETADADVQSVIEIYESSGAIEGAREKCRELRDAALEAIGGLPEPLLSLLSEFVSLIVDRKK